MIVVVSRISQILIAVVVAAALISVDVVAYGPDIDGRTPSLQDTIPMTAIETSIVLLFALSAIALFRWHQFGWWSSIVLDGLLSVAALSMATGDFRDRYVVTEAGREAFRGDLTIHGALLLLCAGATGLLIAARTRYLANEAT